MNHTMIYIPDYFDYVRLRNYFREKEISFTNVCEYTPDAKVARARGFFFDAKRHFMLYTERFHFFHRYTIKAIRHLIFYSLPTYPQLYSEMCNSMQECNQALKRRHCGSSSNMTVSAIYCAYDVLTLAAIVTDDKARHMINKDKNIYMFVTGDTNNK